MSLATYFVENPIPCRLLLNQGSLIKVSKLGCLEDPPIYTLTPAVATIGATSVSVTVSAAVPSSYLAAISATNPLVIEKGRTLYFGGTAAVVTATTRITVPATATVIPVRALTAAIAITNTASILETFTLLSPTDLPLTNNTTTVESTDLTSGSQASTQQVIKDLSVALAWNGRADDEADWQVLHKAADKLEDIYVHIYRKGGLHTFGRAQVNNPTRTGAIKEVMRCTAQLMFQPDYAQPTLASYLSAADLAYLTSVTQLAGFASVT